jgi:hypothetical protein
MSMEYYTMTTNAGDQAIAHAIQTGTTTTFKQIAVGDGNGTYYEPAKTQTALRREVWRGNAVVSLDVNNPKRVIVTATIPATTGGFTIREAGIFDTTNAMMVISKLPLSEKVAPESGASSDLVIRLYVEVSDAGAVNITVDPSAVMATKADVTNAVEPISTGISAHMADAVKHTTQADKDKIAAAVQLATIGGVAVPKSGGTLQIPDTLGGLVSNDYSHARAHLYTDANLMVNDGGYLCLPADAHAPWTDQWSTIDVVQGGTGAIIQFAVSADNLNFAVRHFNGAAWGGWEYLDTTTSRPLSQTLYATRDMSIMGVQTISGLVGKPRKITILAIVYGTVINSIGSCTRDLAQYAMSYQKAYSLYIDNTANAIQLGNTDSDGVWGKITAILNGSFDITWIKSGAGITGTCNVHISVEY